MRERVCGEARRIAGDDARRDRFVEQLQDARSALVSDALEHVQREFAPDHGCDREQLVAFLRQRVEPAPDRFAHALRQCEALQRGISGWVRNKSDGTVEAVLHGEPGKVDDLVRACRHGPSLARVDRVHSEPAEYDGLEDFRIEAST